MTWWVTVHTGDPGEWGELNLSKTCSGERFLTAPTWVATGKEVITHYAIYTHGAYDEKPRLVCKSFKLLVPIAVCKDAILTLGNLDKDIFLVTPESKKREFGLLLIVVPWALLILGLIGIGIGIGKLT
jgi:hypothetical protein